MKVVICMNMHITSPRYAFIMMLFKLDDKIFIFNNNASLTTVRIFKRVG
jgi:hypothetical protein